MAMAFDAFFSQIGPGRVSLPLLTGDPHLHRPFYIESYLEA